MKKFLVLSLISLLVLAFGMTAYGQEKAPVLEFKASGFIDMVTEYWKNAVQGTYGPEGSVPAVGIEQVNKKAAYLEARARLRFDAIYGKSMSATFFFEFDSTQWGDSTSGRGAYGAWNADQPALEVKALYFDFAVPYYGIPVPTTFRVGLQTFSIRPHLLQFADGMGITMGMKFADTVTVAPFYFKPWEGQDLNSDDNDVYGFTAAAKISTLNLGGYWLYWNGNNYPQPAANLAYGTRPAYNMDMNWWGAYLDGKLGPVNLKTDFIYDWGSVRARNAGVGHHRVTYSGYCAYGNFDFPWEKFNFGVTGAWTSRADADQTSGGTLGAVAAGLPYTEVASTLPDPTVAKRTRRVGTFVVPPGSESGAVFGEGLVFYSSWVNRGNTGIANTISGTSLSRGPVGGTYMVKGYTGFKVHPDHKITLAAMYIGDNVANGDLFGTYVTDNRRLRDKDTIGIEADVYWEWQIYDKLKYSLGAGYMWPGTAIKYQWINGQNTKINSPWIITSMLVFNF